MASVFGHAMVAAAIGTSSNNLSKSVKFWILALICCTLPDVDVIMFRFGISYEHPFGHRGFTHSLTFAFLLSLFIKFTFYRNIPLNSKSGLQILLLFFVLTSSHGLLDAMTNGGRGIAFFGPFENTRYFLPFRPIQVSPMSASTFFNTDWGYRVLQSELRWLGIPSMIFIILVTLIRNRKNIS